jgi:transcriptional regulator with XRE-family HTH domain
MNERLKELRKMLNISQEELGTRLGVTRAAISRLESGERNITEQMILSIIREFNVTEKWFRSGEGEMFIQLPPEDEYVRAAAEISKDDDEKIIQQIIIEYWKLNPDAKKHVKEYILNIAKSIKIEE